MILLHWLKIIFFGKDIMEEFAIELIELVIKHFTTDKGKAVPFKGQLLKLRDAISGLFPGE